MTFQFDSSCEVNRELRVIMKRIEIRGMSLQM
jgi:hypothetical protein